MLRRLALSFAFLALSAAPSLAAEPPRVAVSIKPVHSLAAAVMDGVGAPFLIVKGSGSEHSFALTPSDARYLAKADLAFWIGPEMETFLIPVLKNLPRTAKQIPLADVDGMKLLPLREGGAWEAHEHENHKGHKHAAQEAEYDLHIWLDPENALRIATHMVATLAARDPERAERYQANLKALEARLKALDSDLRAKLSTVAKKPFIVFHDAYAYLENRYGLNAVGSVRVAPERAPGAKRLHELRSKIQTGGAVCLFSEPQYPDRLLASVTEGLSVRTGRLDPLGSALPEGKDQYFGMMRGLADSLTSCLGGAG